MSFENDTLSRYLVDEAATVALAQQLALAIFPALSTTYQKNLDTDTDPNLDLSVGFDGARIYLQGDLGAGKTCFVRAFLQQLGVTGRIKSPTYTLLETYKVSRLYLYHFDFYRFNDPDEWQDAGFEEQLLDQAVVLVEWPDKASQQLPPPDILVSLDYIHEGRQAVLRAISDKGQQWLNNID